MMTVIKTITTTVLLSVLLGTTGNADARLKYYRYNGEIPMVETTLNMMVAMGVLEQIPGHLVHDGNPYSRLANTQYGGHYALPVNTGYYNAPGYDRYRGWAPNPYASNVYAGAYGYPYGYDSGYPYGYGGGYRNWNSPWGGQWASDPRFAPQWSSPWNATWGDPWNSPQWGYPQGNNPWNTTWGDPWNRAYGGQLNSPWSSLWGNRLNSPWSNSPWTSSLNYPLGGAANNLWSSPLSNTIVNPFANPLPGAGLGTTTPGYPGNVVSPGYTPGNTSLYNPGNRGSVVQPGYNPGNTSLYNYGNPGNIVPPGNMPGNNPVNNPLYNYGNPGNVVPPGNPQGYNPGNTSFYNYGNSGTSSFSNDRRSSGAPAGFDASKVNSFSINNISLKSTADTAPRSSSAKRNSANATVNRRLDGLWIGDRGEMLGIRGNHFLWYDGKERYANGSLRLTTDELKITRSGTRRELSMHYRVVGNALYTIGRSGKTRTFQRTPLMQQSYLDGELYASPSNFQVGSASPFSANALPGSMRDNALTPYPGGESNLDPGSVTVFLDQGSDGAGAKSNRGEKSPLWSPTAKSAKTSRQLQQESSSQLQLRQYRPRAGVADSDAGQRGVIRNSLAPFPIRQSTKSTRRISGATPVGSNSAQGADTRTWPSAGPDQSKNIWHQRAEETFEQPDASQYLYSYLKDNRYALPTAAASAGKNGNIWAPTASSTSDTAVDSATPSEKRIASSNIWKPSPTYIAQRRNGEALNVYYADGEHLADAKALANANVTKFVWAE
jgi:hypothetical protein